MGKCRQFLIMLTLFIPRNTNVQEHSFMEIDHEIFSTVILSLPLIQEGQLSVSGEECAQYWLTT